jgi:hypothetical protein
VPNYSKLEWASAPGIVSGTPPFRDRNTNSRKTIPPGASFLLRFAPEGQTCVDYDANGNRLTTGFFTHTGTRLAAGFDPHGNDWNH